MKNSLIMLCSGFIGAAVGIIVTKIILEKRYDEKYRKAIAEMEKYYGKVDEYKRVDRDEEGSSDPGYHEGTRMTTEERREMKEELRNQRTQKHERVDYAGMYRTKNGYTENQLAEGEYPNEDDSEEDPVNGEMTLEEEHHYEHQKNKNKPPRIISEDDAAALPELVDKQVLFFYTINEVLVDEDDNVIDEPGYLIGDALTKYDFIDSDEVVIFVMNYQLDTCYEVRKMFDEWEG